MTSLFSTLAARLTVRRLAKVRAIARNSVTFLAAFTAYEATLIVFSLLLGGIENHTLAIQGRVLAINTVTLVGLFALDRVGVAIGLAPAVRSPSLVAAQHA